MSKYNYAPGAIHIDHHKELNIDVKSVDDAIRLMSAFMSDRAEDVTSESISSPTSDNRPKKNLPFFVPAKLAELGTYTEEEFDALYHDAVKSGAPKLAKFLKHYKDLEVFNTGNLNKKETFEKLKAYFGAELDFGYPNFAAYY